MDTKNKPQQKVLNKSKKKIDKFIIDETQIKVGSQYIWLWVATIEPKYRQILLYIDTSFERTICFL